MDSICVEWLFEKRQYRIHIPGQPDIFVDAADLETLCDQINAAVKEATK